VSGAASHALAVEYRNVSRRFDNGVYANRNVSFGVAKGTLHFLVGENGAGKTTALKVLFGLVKPTEGSLLLHGKPFAPASPVEAVSRGIGMVHQHFMLSETETALDNVLLVVESVRNSPVPRALRPLHRAEALQKLEALAREFGLPVDFHRLVKDLGVGEQQRLEILKLLFLDADILVLDEPTAVLTPFEATALFTTLKRLVAQGKSVIVVTHKLREVTAHADAVTVLRQGKVVASLVRPHLPSIEELANLMVGHTVDLSLQGVLRSPAPGPDAEVLLRFESISLLEKGAAKPRLSNVTFEVRAGEIVGIAGVEGNGQSDLLALLTSPSAWAERCQEASCVLKNEGHKKAPRFEILGHDAWTLDARSLRALSWGFVPEDRLAQGLLPDSPVEENYLLGRQHLPAYSRFGFLRRKALRATAQAASEAFDVRPRDLTLPAGSLSGGNQQKVLLAREMALAPRLLVVAQPTRGVDVGAIEVIHRRLLERRQAGAGLLVVSSELDEVLALADRVFVFHAGALLGPFEGERKNETDVGLAMGGLTT
jgi:ABC-type uncharacterized transport system ATPase subunit